MTPLRAYRCVACDVCHDRNVTVVRMGIDYICEACCLDAVSFIRASDQASAIKQEAKQLREHQVRRKDILKCRGKAHPIHAQEGQ